MEQERIAQEELLRAWMKMAVCIRGNRLLSILSLNEMLICSYLYQQHCSGGEPITATELCTQMNLLKSQMNHLLTALEEKGFVRRERGETDRRMVCVYLQDAGISVYLKEHENVLGILRAVHASLGDDNTRTLARLLNQAVGAAVEYQTQQ